MITITKTNKPGIQNALTTLTRAFTGYPMLRYFEPDPRRTAHMARRWSVYVLRQGLSFGECFAASERCEAVTVWLPVAIDGRPSVGGLRQTLIDMEYMATVRPTAAARSIYGDGFLHRWHREAIGGPHWMLYVVGTSPECQRKGHAAALLREFFRKTDSDGLPCYVDTLDENNRPFYERLGFRPAAEKRLPPFLGSGECGFWNFIREQG